VKPVVLDFMRQLQDRVPRLKRGTGATEVQFFVHPSPLAFEVRLSFKDGWHYSRMYSEAELLGSTRTRPPSEQSIYCRPCECISSLGEEVLAHLMQRRT
jgi:hypothetical protein